METFELSPDGRKSIACFRSLEQAIEHAQAVLGTRPDVGEFRIYSTTRFGHRLVGTVTRESGYRPAPVPWRPAEQTFSGAKSTHPDAEPT